MKAKEAPEKIYVNFHFTETHPGRSPMVTKQGVNKYDVVYVRTDAFIEKAEKWFEEHFMNRLKWEIATYEFENIQSMIDEFRKYMEEE